MRPLHARTADVTTSQRADVFVTAAALSAGASIDPATEHQQEPARRAELLDAVVRKIHDVQIAVGGASDVLVGATPSGPPSCPGPPPAIPGEQRRSQVCRRCLPPPATPQPHATWNLPAGEKRSIRAFPVSTTYTPPPRLSTAMPSRFVELAGARARSSRMFRASCRRGRCRDRTARAHRPLGFFVGAAAEQHRAERERQPPGSPARTPTVVLAPSCRDRQSAENLWAPLR